MKHLIGKILIDIDGTECKVIDATSNSINVWIEKKTNKGISVSNWFADEKRTWERFKLKKDAKEITAKKV